MGVKETRRKGTDSDEISRDNSSASSTQGQINGVVSLGEIEARESSGFKD